MEICAVVEAAGAVDVPSAASEYQRGVVEAAGAKDVPSATQDALVGVIDAATARDLDLGIGGVVTFILTERARGFADLDVLQIGAAFIIEQVQINELWLGLPVFLGELVEQASAVDLVSRVGTQLADVVEQAGAGEFIVMDGSTFSIALTERAGAYDAPSAQIMRFIAVVEGAQGRDASYRLTDLWVPVDDSQSGIWVPVNDNPAGPWLPVIP
jgi:hypothetical protein